jgi:SAM-dependent methyltransferase
MSTGIDYSFNQNTHTLTGAGAALPVILGDRRIDSLLDVGCGPGTWLAAAESYGIKDLHGVDGIEAAPEDFHARTAAFTQADLTRPFSLGRKFDLALCTEVAEHLPRESADILIASLCAHADLIAFSAAIPGQPGQHHVTCEWPAFWQEKFNRCGFVCEDTLRWKLWDINEIEPWYRQNFFLARHDPARAGKERRLPAVLHPEIFGQILDPLVREAKREAHGEGQRDARRQMEQSYFSGELPAFQYAVLCLRAIRGKLRRFASWVKQQGSLNKTQLASFRL